MREKELQFFSGFTRRPVYGANIDGDGIYFSIFSRHALRVWLVLFDAPDSDCPSLEIELDPVVNRTGDVWHIWIKGLREGQLYLWKMDSPGLRGPCHRFDPGILLLDPFARAITGSTLWDYKNPEPMRYGEGKGTAGIPKCVAYSDIFDWQGDQPLRHPLSETIIYECHVRGLTAGVFANVEHPGTYAGVVEKIPYFKELGITALEFLPVQEFDAIQHRRFHPLSQKLLLNYWGYHTVCFFAPNGRYCSSGTMGQQVREFKYMVRELHKAGIEVILDIVFNHTAEGDQYGPVFSFKGIDNSIYYMMDPTTGRYLDYTGCGNTINCNHPVVKDFILNCLYYWVLQMHVDGFRFDLASVLGRDEKGNLLPNPPLLRRIEEDPLLRDTKIIAEAWDAAGAYQVGEFTGRWGEWNGRYRDEVRRFWRGEGDSLGHFATRLAGSSDLFGDDGRTPHHSINFITSHDGFTLNDWTSYEKKHNEANGQNNQDGDNWNFSYNHGTEGETENPEIKTIRLRQAKNMFATLMLSLGVPMLLAGDEFMRTQKGNNNPYCQDNEISWFDWDLVKKNSHMRRFVQEMIRFRKRMRPLKKQSFYTGKPDFDHEHPDIVWYGAEGHEPVWHGTDLALAALVNGCCYSGCNGTTDDHIRNEVLDFFIMFNANLEPRTFAIPQAPNKGSWKIAIDSQQPSPKDIYFEGEEPPILPGVRSFLLASRSLAVLIARVV